MSLDAVSSNATPSELMLAVAALVGAPDLVLPWLDRFYDAGDATLVVAACGALDGRGEAGGRGALGDRGATKRTNAASAGLGAPDEALDRAVRRAVLDRDHTGAYTPASFRARLEVWAMFEGWKDVPESVHRELADWEVGNYTEANREALQALQEGRPADSDQAGYTYLLLPEAEEVIRSEPRVFLFPCDCRAIVGNCKRPSNVCLRFDNDRGIGWEISAERAIEILHATDKAGLMHTDHLDRRAPVSHAICNCCTDCCFPHLATRRLGAEAVWPVRRHVAAIDGDACKQCGRCARRCPFAAITADPEGRPRLEPATCRGCGLCSTTCPTEAIAMRPLAPTAAG